MTKQSEAHRLADRLEGRWALHPEMQEAAAELRRLQALLEAEQALHQRVTYPELQRLRAQRDALLEALQDLCDTLGECGMTEKARAAIAKAEEKT